MGRRGRAMTVGVCKTEGRLAEVALVVMRGAAAGNGESRLRARGLRRRAERGRRRWFGKMCERGPAATVAARGSGRQACGGIRSQMREIGQSGTRRCQ